MTDAQLIFGLGLPTIAALIGFTLSVYLVNHIREEMRGMRAEIREEFRGIRSELSAISRIIADTNKRLGRIEGRP